MTKSHDDFVQTAEDFPAVFFRVLEGLKGQLTRPFKCPVVHMDAATIHFWLVSSDHPDPIELETLPHPLYKDLPQLLDRVEYAKADGGWWAEVRGQMVEILRAWLDELDFGGMQARSLVLLTTAPQGQLLAGGDLRALGQAPRKFSSFHWPQALTSPAGSSDWPFCLLPQPSTFISAAHALDLLNLGSLENGDGVMHVGPSLEVFLKIGGRLLSTSSLWTPLEDQLSLDRPFVAYLAEVERAVSRSGLDLHADSPKDLGQLLDPGGFRVFRQAQAALRQATDSLMEASQLTAADLHTLYVLTAESTSQDESLWRALQLIPPGFEGEVVFVKPSPVRQLDQLIKAEDSFIDWPPLDYLELSQWPAYYKDLIRHIHYK